MFFRKRLIFERTASWSFRRGEWDRPGLHVRVERMARELQAALEAGCRCADAKAATFCVNVLALYPALWLPGMRADLALLSTNPIEDIRNTDQVNAV